MTNSGVYAIQQKNYCAVLGQSILFLTEMKNGRELRKNAHTFRREKAVPNAFCAVG
jgi:hypothetical protein